MIAEQLQDVEGVQRGGVKSSHDGEEWGVDRLIPVLVPHPDRVPEHFCRRSSSHMTGSEVAEQVGSVGTFGMTVALG